MENPILKFIWNSQEILTKIMPYIIFIYEIVSETLKKFDKNLLF